MKKIGLLLALLSFVGCEDKETTPKADDKIIKTNEIVETNEVIENPNYDHKETKAANKNIEITEAKIIKTSEIVETNEVIENTDYEHNK